MDPRLRVPLSIVVLLALPHPSLAQTTTGRIVGQVVDGADQPSPGATVTVTSPSLQGVRSTVSDERGEFHVAFLPPGIYEAKGELPGFQPMSIAGIRVSLDRTATVRMRLEVAPVSITVRVTPAPPEIDVTNTTTGLNATADLYTRIPMARSFFAVARVVPGTQEDETGTAFNGSTGAENQYIVDGLNVTGTYAGGKGGKELNLDYVKEVEVKTGGLPAEYGRMTGGILNVITESGGNDFHGSAFGYFAGSGLRSHDRRIVPSEVETRDSSAQYDLGAELGGRIVRDRLWFFGALNRVADNSETEVVRDLHRPGAPAVGSVVTGRRRDDRFATKLTWRPTASSSVVLSVFGDPSRFEGPIAGIGGPPSTYEGTVTRGGTNIAARYEATFGDTFLVRAQFGQHRQKFSMAGPGTELPRIEDYTVDPPAVTGGIGEYGSTSSRRDAWRFDVSKFMRSHELKIGGDVEPVTTACDYCAFSGGEVLRRFEWDGQAIYSHHAVLDPQAPGFDRDDPSTWRLLPHVSRPGGSIRNFSAYARDSWRIRKSLTLNLGLRFERQNVEDRNGKTQFTVDNWAPRLGFAWDVKRDGRSKLYAAFSRYFESIPTALASLAFGSSTEVIYFNFDPTAGSFAPAPGAPGPFIWGGRWAAVAVGIEGQSGDEWILGFERELPGDFVVGIEGGWRRLRRLIEDVTAGTGDYREVGLSNFIGNPGEGPAATIAFFDGSSAPCPKPRRDNYSLDLTARKRLSRGWQLLTSYVFSRLEGNYDGMYQRSTGQWAPNWNSGFDKADFLVNASGRLTSESGHQVKVDGSYEFAGKAAGLNLGLSTHWYSGLPLNAYGYSVSYESWEYYLLPRGSLGRHPADYEVDFLASYPIRMGKAARLLMEVAVFNLLDRQAVLRYDEHYNLEPCGGVPEGLCTGDGGLRTQPDSLAPLGSIRDPRQTATNPGFLNGSEFTAQRSLRLGVRLSF